MGEKILTRLIKQACPHTGLDKARFSGHAARRGLLTHGGDLQLPLVDVMRQSRHKSVETHSAKSRARTSGAPTHQHHRAGLRRKLKRAVITTALLMQDREEDLIGVAVCQSRYS